MYIEQEIGNPENQSPPLGEGFALAVMRAKVRNYRRAGTDVGEIMQASQRLAHAQASHLCIEFLPELLGIGEHCPVQYSGVP